MDAGRKLLTLKTFTLTDRQHHYLTSGNIPKIEGGQIHLTPVTISLQKYYWHKKEALLEQTYFTGRMPLLAPTTVLGHVVILRHSPLPKSSTNVVEKLAQEGMNATSWKPIRSPLPTQGREKANLPCIICCSASYFIQQVLLMWYMSKVPKMW